jgi:hypothetical protein
MRFPSSPQQITINQFKLQTYTLHFKYRISWTGFVLLVSNGKKQLPVETEPWNRLITDPYSTENLKENVR